MVEIACLYIITVAALFYIVDTLWRYYKGGDVITIEIEDKKRKR